MIRNKVGNLGFTEFGTVLVMGPTLKLVMRGGRTLTHVAPIYGGNANMRYLQDQPGFTIGTSTFRDGLRVIYFYDKGDDNFGYAWNIDAPDNSEWGFAPVGEYGSGTEGWAS